MGKGLEFERDAIGAYECVPGDCERIESAQRKTVIRCVNPCVNPCVNSCENPCT